MTQAAQAAGEFAPGIPHADLDKLKLPLVVRSLAQIAFAERTDDLFAPAPNVIEVAGHLVVGRVDESPLAHGGAWCKLHTMWLDPEGNLSVRVHTGARCNGACLCYVLKPDSVIDDNVQPSGLPLFGQPDPKVLFEITTENAKSELTNLIQADAQTDPFSVYAWSSQQWRQHFENHDKLGAPVVGAFEQVAGLRSGSSPR